MFLLLSLLLGGTFAGLIPYADLSTGVRCPVVAHNFAGPSMHLFLALLLLLLTASRLSR